MGKPKAVGAYIFAGGFTHGILEAGFDVVSQLEEGEYGVATSRLNHPGVPVYPAKVGPPGAGWPTEALMDAGIDLVYANPPCAPFSNAARSKAGTPSDRWKDDPRTACIRNAFSLLASIRPRVWVWESVQAAFTNGRGLIDELTEDARMLGYQASYVLFENAKLGVPQYRPRLFVVFHDINLRWEYPGLDLITVREAFDPITSGEIIDDSPDPPRPRQGNHALQDYLTVLEATPPGTKLRKAWELLNPDPSLWRRNAQGNVVGRPCFLDRRLAWDVPSKTITGGATNFHPEESRYITVMEQQLLCGYPPEYAFVGPLSSMYAQTAQAVMPPTGKWLGDIVRRGIEAGVKEKCRGPYIVNLEQKTIAVRRPPARRPMTVTKEPTPTFEPRIPEGDFVGPTALARAMMIADPQVEDGEIMAGAKALFGPTTGKPKLFTRADLARLRERIAKKEAAARG